MSTHRRSAEERTALFQTTLITVTNEAVPMTIKLFNNQIIGFFVPLSFFLPTMSQPTENTSLLERRGLKKMKYSTPTSLLSSTRSDLNSPRSPAEIDDKKHQHFKWLNKRTGPYDEDGQSLVKENTGVRVWNESYSSIGKQDMIHNRCPNSLHT